MSLYLSLPVLFFKFWYIEAPLRLVKFFFSLNHASLQILSLPLMIRTFFKPLKNEYRQGLVVFSIAMGIIVKTVLILFDLVIYLAILILEVMFIILFLAWPILTFLILFIK